MNISEETKRDCKIWTWAFLVGCYSTMLLIRYFQPDYLLAQNTMSYWANSLLLFGVLVGSFFHLMRTE